jgi:GTP-binding protein
MRTIRAIENSDVCIVMSDATEGFDSQDISIFSLAIRNHKGVVLVLNKWDLVEKGNKTHKEFEEYVRNRIAPFTDVPIIFTSVLNKQRIFKVLEMAIEVYKNKSRRIPF